MEDIKSKITSLHAKVNTANGDAKAKIMGSTMRYNASSTRKAADKMGKKSSKK